ncbi:hypothetical protein EIP91_012325 [Steccherinum ochraceum]|uniref:Uncharacterized protein n=1 Tax=Steccherinum ochraceum TaxID=92696 RepID=A0A4R0RX10_9APHY|nr:hypothetical protein EIP91_012325 [Steccherinum ochraceum]
MIYDPVHSAYGPSFQLAEYDLQCAHNWRAMMLFELSAVSMSPSSTTSMLRRQLAMAHPIVRRGESTDYPHGPRWYASRQMEGDVIAMTWGLRAFQSTTLIHTSFTDHLAIRQLSSTINRVSTASQILAGSPLNHRVARIEDHDGKGTSAAFLASSSFRTTSSLPTSTDNLRGMGDHSRLGRDPAMGRGLDHLPFLDFLSSFPKHIPTKKLADWLDFYANIIDPNV